MLQSKGHNVYFYRKFPMKQFFLIMIMTVSLSAAAQKFNGGVLAGGLISQVDGDSWKGYDKVGFMAGGFVGLRLSPHSSFQMEMEYIQKGSRKNADLEKGDVSSYLFRIHYLEIPVLYQFTFARRLSVEAGPAVDVLLGYYEEMDNVPDPPTEPLRPVTLSGILGASVNITKNLKTTFRFNYSLLSLRNSAPPYPAVYRKILFEYGQYNNVLSLSLSWDFKPAEW
jgi:hypothetical protein